MLFKGNKYTDERGSLTFCNAFDMTEVVRFYEIAPANTTVIRAWQGHRKEKKWFYCSAGGFVVNLIKLDDFDAPSEHIVAEQHVLVEANTAILAISEGYATGFRALAENSKLMVFSNFDLEASKQDDFRYPVEKWNAEWEHRK